MAFLNQFPAVLLGLTVVSSIVVVLPQRAEALTGSEINDVAREVTVLIQAGSPGSGVIIAQDSSTYYVLTASHVVRYEDEYSIVTHDKQAYSVDYSRVHNLPGVDLAIVEFVSDESYPTATLAKTEHVAEGQTVFVSGWPYPGTEIQERIRQFTTGEISGLPDNALSDGYQLVYTNVTRTGMSGGPVFDTSGRVIGIHGRAESEVVNDDEVSGLEEAGGGSLVDSARKVGFNLGIPTNTFLTHAQQNDLYLSLRVENSPPGNSSVSFEADSQADPRDRIDDINATLGTIRESLNVLEDARRILRF